MALAFKNEYITDAEWGSGNRALAQHTEGSEFNPQHQINQKVEAGEAEVQDHPQLQGDFEARYMSPCHKNNS